MTGMVPTKLTTVTATSSLQAPPRIIELWRVEYKKDAYEDQTGAKHWGHVVYEQVVVEEIGRFDQYEYYGKEWVKDAGIYAIEPETGRKFKGSQNLVDYYGGRGWTLDPRSNNQVGVWKEVPRNAAGYCYPEGNAPVQRLLENQPH